MIGFISIQFLEIKQYVTLKCCYKDFLPQGSASDESQSRILTVIQNK